MSEEQVAIIRDAKIGMGDRGEPTLRFTTYLTESRAADHHLSWDDAYAVMKRVTDVRDLEGKPCWVRTDNGICRFLRLWSS